MQKTMRGTGLVVWCVGVVLGCSTTFICKLLDAEKSVGLNGATKFFKKPIAAEMLLFLGMGMGIPMHALGLRFGGAPLLTVFKTHGRVMALLALPACCDVAASALLFLGLLYLSMSQTQLLRSSIAIFSTVRCKQSLSNIYINHVPTRCLPSQIVRIPMLGKYPGKHMVCGLFVNAIGVAIVIACSTEATNENMNTRPNAFLGVCFIMLSSFIQAVQFVAEEKVLVGGVPPMVVMGIEGAWGIIITGGLVLPMAQCISGPDTGSVENSFDTWAQLMHSPTLCGYCFMFFVVVCVFNVIQMWINYRYGSVYNSLIATLRPLGVWSIELAAYYSTTGSQLQETGSGWTMPWSALQLGGMMLLFVGTAVFNENIKLRRYFKYDDDNDGGDEGEGRDEGGRGHGGRGGGRDVGADMMNKSALENRNSRDSTCGSSSGMSKPLLGVT
jgi:hypothetical protein